MWTARAPAAPSPSRWRRDSTRATSSSPARPTTSSLTSPTCRGRWPRSRARSGERAAADALGSPRRRGGVDRRGPPSKPHGAPRPGGRRRRGRAARRRPPRPRHPAARARRDLSRPGGLARVSARAAGLGLLVVLASAVGAPAWANVTIESIGLEGHVTGRPSAVPVRVRVTNPAAQAQTLELTLRVARANGPLGEEGSFTAEVALDAG